MTLYFSLVPRTIRLSFTLLVLFFSGGFINMAFERVFPVLLLLIPLAVDGWLIKETTCGTIQDQLRLIDHAIDDAAHTIQMDPFYTSKTVDARLTLLMRSYKNILDSFEQHRKQVSTFVQGKFKQFNIPVDDLEENTMQLEKIFSVVEYRNALQRLEVVKQKRSNKNIATELDQQQSVLQGLEQTQQQLRMQLEDSNIRHDQLKILNRKLQANIDHNSAAV
uniref:Uncharacterized protein n=1 Tax=Anopheles minimus TaxID=112268 RepID=A0A182WQC0_9DIPT